MTGRLNTDGWWAQRLLLEGPPAACAERPVVRMILDCGANLGQARSLYRQLFPAARIHSFEPNPDTCLELRANAADDPETVCWQLAIGASSDSAELYLAEQSYADSLVRKPDSGAAGDGRSGACVRVDVIDLDTFCAREGIDHVDILKLDVEGVEMEALEGAAGLLERGAIDLVFCEFNPKPRHPGQARGHDVMARLWEFGYRLFDFYNPLYIEPHKGVALLDALFLHESLHPAFNDRSVPLDFSGGG